MLLAVYTLFLVSVSSSSCPSCGCSIATDSVREAAYNMSGCSYSQSSVTTARAACPPYFVMVGLNAAGGDYQSSANPRRFQGICKEVVYTTTGAFIFKDPTTGELTDWVGTNSSSNSASDTSVTPYMCPAGTAVVGFQGVKSCQGLFSRWQLLCRSLNGGFLESVGYPIVSQGGSSGTSYRHVCGTASYVVDSLLVDVQNSNYNYGYPGVLIASTMNCRSLLVVPEGSHLPSVVVNNTCTPPASQQVCVDASVPTNATVIWSAHEGVALPLMQMDGRCIRVTTVAFGMTAVDWSAVNGQCLVKESSITLKTPSWCSTMSRIDLTSSADDPVLHGLSDSFSSFSLTQSSDGSSVAISMDEGYTFQLTSPYDSTGQIPFETRKLYPLGPNRNRTHGSISFSVNNGGYYCSSISGSVLFSFVGRNSDGTSSMLFSFNLSCNGQAVPLRAQVAYQILPSAAPPMPPKQTVATTTRPTYTPYPPYPTNTPYPPYPLSTTGAPQTPPPTLYPYYTTTAAAINSEPASASGLMVPFVVITVLVVLALSIVIVIVVFWNRPGLSALRARGVSFWQRLRSHEQVPDEEQAELVSPAIRDPSRPIPPMVPSPSILYPPALPGAQIAIASKDDVFLDNNEDF